MDEQDMLERLGRAMETQSTVSEGSASTQQIISRISRQLDQFGARDGAAEESEDLGFAFDRASSDHGAFDRTKPHVELPNRETPFEVWARRNQRPPTPPNYS